MGRIENYKYVFRSCIPGIHKEDYSNKSRRIAFQFPFPIILALMLNEIRLTRCKVVQTIYTFPHFYLGYSCQYYDKHFKYKRDGKCNIKHDGQGIN